MDAIIRSGLSRFTDEVGRLWCKLADYYIRLGQFERARDVYEEAINSVVSDDICVMGRLSLSSAMLLLLLRSPSGSLLLQLSLFFLLTCCAGRVVLPRKS